jgi:hypothetical protein|tara:strand:- start:151 stop:387 length:237 start_codon:yes stop_codon:yes gene_type:complete
MNQKLLAASVLVGFLLSYHLTSKMEGEEIEEKKRKLALFSLRGQASPKGTQVKPKDIPKINNTQKKIIKVPALEEFEK